MQILDLTLRMLFKEVIGQQQAKDSFVNLYHSGRLPHALILSGKEGTGGLSFALAIATMVLCEAKDQNDACGICSSCIKVKALAHPDLHLTFPSFPPKPNSKANSKNFIREFREVISENPYISTYDWLQYIKAENKQGNISAEECREIIDTLYLKSFEGGYKIQLIWRPEYLGKEGNILLKIIEEPPPQTLIILVAEDIEDILPTILSRTQLLMLPPIHTKDIAESLTQQKQLSEQQAFQLAHIAEGNYNKALALIHSSDSNLLEFIKNWFNAVFSNNGVKMHEWVEDVAKLGREQQKNILLYAQSLIEQSMKYMLISDYNAPLQDAESDFCKKFAKQQLSISIYQNLMKALNDAIYHIERNVHGKTQLLYTSVQMQYIIKNMELKTA